MFARVTVELALSVGCALSAEAASAAAVVSAAASRGRVKRGSSFLRQVGT
jgi:hypothetical protein